MPSALNLQLLIGGKFAAITDQEPPLSSANGLPECFQSKRNSSVIAFPDKSLASSSHGYVHAIVELNVPAKSTENVIYTFC